MYFQSFVVDFNEEQLEVHAGGERDEARGAVGDRDAWLRQDDGQLSNKYKQTNRQADKGSVHKQIQTSKQTNKWSVLKEMQTNRQTSGQMVSSQRNANKWSALKQTQTWANLIPIQSKSVVTISL